MKNSLTKKEKNFCRFYVTLQNSREAASNAGYGMLSRLAGEKLLMKKEVKDEIARLNKLNEDLSCAKQGFRRLAFGSVADAIRLIDGERDNLDSMDLFMVSDIKLVKGGGMEVKFYDRQKALESLASLEQMTSADGSLPIYRALENSARAIALESEAYQNEG
ncbi:MAG TPA: terminase small subunit [Ruminococcaceae bacterium]|nr:terminase small subunit [Oscillospiraceae bacterium]